MTIKNIMCEISYDGTNYHGYQIQPNQRTIQGELQAAISAITEQEVNIYASGRTDAGVHARKQVCNFIIESSLKEEQWSKALNAILPNDIVITESKEVTSTFHARYQVKEKIYRYYIHNSKVPNVFRKNYTWHVPYLLDFEKMEEASQLFIGSHDFTSFSSAKTDIEDKVRIIYHTQLWKENNEIVFEISGNGFLYNMVRIMIGTLVEVGSGKYSVQEIEKILDAKDRTQAGKTVPPQGLVLWDVKY